MEIETTEEFGIDLDRASTDEITNRMRLLENDIKVVIIDA
jgi:hypothetical protein